MIKNNKNNFTDQEIKNFSKLYDALKEVHIRLIREGYKIEEDKIITPKYDK